MEALLAVWAVFGVLFIGVRLMTFDFRERK